MLTWLFKSVNIHVVILLFIAGSAFAGEHLDLPDYSKEYNAERDPIGDISVARVKAIEKDKLLLLIAGGDWCSWCLVLDKDIKRNKKFRDIFEIVKVYIGPENQNNELFSKFPKVIAFPHFFILNTRLELVGSQSVSSFEGSDQFSSRRRYNRHYMNEFLDQWADYLKGPVDHQMQPVAKTLPH